MEIHKPKPWRGVREFLKEIGTIVIGVLIALAAEQAVEALHWRHVVEQERANLRGESEWNQQTMFARLQIEPCVTRRLAELDELFARHRQGKPLNKTAPIGRPAYWTGGNQAWDLALSDQAVAHMSQANKTLYTALAQVYGSYDGTRLEERVAWRELQVLDHADELAPADWSALRGSLEAVRDSDQQMRIHIVDTDWLAAYRALGLPKPKPDAKVMAQAPVVALCRPMLATSQP
jgi:hypothetical protein